MSNSIKGNTSQTPCRNILIHGYCKFADKGCMFKHDTPGNSTTAATTSNSSTSSTAASAADNTAVQTQGNVLYGSSINSKKKLNADSPVFMPGKPLSSGSSANSSMISSSTSSPRIKSAKTSAHIENNGAGNGGNSSNTGNTSESNTVKPSTRTTAANIAAPAFVPRSNMASSGTNTTTVTNTTKLPSSSGHATVKHQFSPERFSKTAIFRPESSYTDSYTESYSEPQYGPGPPDNDFSQHPQVPTGLLGGGLDANVGNIGLGHGHGLGMGPGPAPGPVAGPDHMVDMGIMPDEFASMNLGQPGHGQPNDAIPSGNPYPTTTATQGMPFQHHTSYPLNYHVYAPTPLGVTKQYLEPHQRMLEDFFIPNDLREELQRKNEATLQVIPGLNLPEYVHVYHSLVLLDTSPAKSNKSFGYPSWNYKCVSNIDGRVYCMRRIEGFRLTNERAMKLLKRWARVHSPSVVPLHEAFTTREFGDNSLIFIYDFYPMSATVYDTYFSPHSTYQIRNAVNQPHLLPEELIWGYISQLLMALKSIHAQGLSAQTIEPSKLIITKKGRIRINCCGIMDFLEFGQLRQQDEHSLQREDVINIGRMTLSLACCSLEALSNLEKSLAQVEKYYSAELLDFIKTILGSAIKAYEAEEKKDKDNESTEGEYEPEKPKELSVTGLIQKYSVNLVDVLDSSLFENDKLEGVLSNELENGRLVRLLTKIDFIVNRPELDQNSNWSETGDRYIISLFRDYVFHQVDEAGNPVIDLNHVLSCLNKLDCGVEESILLLSRDEQNFMIVTYKEIKVCLESAFRELRRR